MEVILLDKLEKCDGMQETQGSNLESYSKSGQNTQEGGLWCS